MSENVADYTCLQIADMQQGILYVTEGRYHTTLNNLRMRPDLFPAELLYKGEMYIINKTHKNLSSKITHVVYQVPASRHEFILWNR